MSMVKACGLLDIGIVVSRPWEVGTLSREQIDIEFISVKRNANVDIEGRMDAWSLLICRKCTAAVMEELLLG